MKPFLIDHRLEEVVAALRRVTATQKQTPKCRIELYRQEEQLLALPIYLVTHSYASKISNLDSSEFFTDLTLYAQGQVELTRLLGHDYIYSAADILDFEAEALGGRLSFPSPRSNPSLTNLPLAVDKDFSRLTIPDPRFAGRLPALIGMKEYLQQHLGDLFEFEATGSAPFSLACNIRGYEEFLMDMITDENYALELLDFCTGVCKASLSAQLQLGLSGIHIADAWASFPMVNEYIYDKFIFPAVRKLFLDLNPVHRSWTGLYGLAKIQDWKGHLKRIVDCGVTELCIYQEDLLKLDLTELATLIEEMGVTIKVGLWGTSLAPYDSFAVINMLKGWIHDLGKRGKVAIHVTNVPWDACIEDVHLLVTQIRRLESETI